jgi:hypothetical protein
MKVNIRLWSIGVDGGVFDKHRPLFSEHREAKDYLLVMIDEMISAEPVESQGMVELRNLRRHVMSLPEGHCLDVVIRKAGGERRVIFDAATFLIDTEDEKCHGCCGGCEN